MQNVDGGWGGANSVTSSIEETALAVDALATWMLEGLTSRHGQTIVKTGGLGDATRVPVAEAACRGAEWLIRNTDHGRSTPASPIGLYFARLWYFEELYPLIFTLSALSKVSRLPDHLEPRTG